MLPCIKCPLILVENISSEYGRLRVANSVGMRIIKKKILLKKYICSIQQIKKYGFNHIIVIGEFIYGILCFAGTLWFLGDYSQRVKKKSEAGRAAWEVAYDEIEGQCMYVRVISFFILIC